MLEANEHAAPWTWICESGITSAPGNAPGGIYLRVMLHAGVHRDKDVAGQRGLVQACGESGSGWDVTL